MNNFKIGQKVLIKKIRHQGVIQLINRDFDVYRVHTLDGYTRAYKESELKLLPEKKACGCHCHHKDIKPLPCWNILTHVLKCSHCVWKVEKKEKIKVGDWVKVVDVGKYFSTYNRWIEKYKVKGWRWKMPLRNGEVGIVKLIKPHGNKYDFTENILLILINDKKLIMIGDDGVKKVEKPKEDKFTLCDCWVEGGDRKLQADSPKDCPKHKSDWHKRTLPISYQTDCEHGLRGSCGICKFNTPEGRGSHQISITEIEKLNLDNQKNGYNQKLYFDGDWFEAQVAKKINEIIERVNSLIQ